MKRPIIKITLIVLFALAACLMIMGNLWIGDKLTQPFPRTIGPPPPSLDITEVKIPSESGSTLAGWLLSHEKKDKAAALFHGIHANRLQMMERAIMFHEQGWSALVIDFQAHGESPGERVAMGWLESMDARAAIQYLKKRCPDARIAALGLSMGGAACLLAEPPLEIDLLIIEQTYSTIHQATSNRLTHHLGRIAPLAAHVLLLQLPIRFGITEGDMRPIDKLSNITAPVMLIAGEKDKSTTVEESLRMYDQINTSKELWIVKDAGHIDYMKHNKKEYKARVIDFINRSH